MEYKNFSEIGDTQKSKISGTNFVGFLNGLKIKDFQNFSVKNQQLKQRIEMLENAK